jgi:hypothetical protein
MKELAIRPKIFTSNNIVRTIETKGAGRKRELIKALKKDDFSLYVDEIENSRQDSSKFFREVEKQLKFKLKKKLVKQIRSQGVILSEAESTIELSKFYEQLFRGSDLPFGKSINLDSRLERLSPPY